MESCDKFASSKQARQLSKYYAGQGGLEPSDEKLLELYDKGLSDTEIAVVLKRSRSLVAHWRRKFGLPAKREIEVEVCDD